MGGCGLKGENPEDEGKDLKMETQVSLISVSDQALASASLALAEQLPISLLLCRKTKLLCSFLMARDHEGGRQLHNSFLWCPLHPLTPWKSHPPPGIIITC